MNFKLFSILCSAKTVQYSCFCDGVFVTTGVGGRYEQSDWGWNDREKREEMMDSRAWYLVARDEEGNPVAFIHFRFDMEDDEEVLYWSVSTVG